MIANSNTRLQVDALVFDAYGTLFDVQSVAETAERLLSGHGDAVARVWRTKQLEYTWLQSLMLSATQRRDDFAALTAQALDYAVESLGLSLTASARHRLLDAYLDLAPFEDAVDALQRSAPIPRVILSNGTREMLEPLAAATGIARHLDAILSVDAAGIYKPSPRVYQLAVDHLDWLRRASASFRPTDGTRRRKGIRLHRDLGQSIRRTCGAPRPEAGRDPELSV